MNQEMVEKNVLLAAKQSPFGQMRLCELELIGLVSTRVSGYCCIGCGNGYEMKLIQCPNKIGVDMLPEGALFPYISQNIFDHTGSFDLQLIRKLVNWRYGFEGPVLWYTDNGNKVKEIDAMVSICKTGDIVGTHDFGTEVPFSMMGEMEKRGFAPMDEYDEYIIEHRCLNYFWERL